MRPLHAWACVAVFAATVVALFALSRSGLLIHRLADVKAPAVLEDRAKALLAELGAARPALDRAMSYAYDGEHFDWAEKNQPRETRYSRLETGEPALIQFWYRESPRPLVSQLGSGDIRWANPPLIVSGMAGVRLDPSGRLLSFYRVPPQVDDGPAAPSAPDWTSLFAAARLDPAAFKPAEPRWTPPFFSDLRAAWEGTYPQRPDIPLRIEAAAYRGRPVSFFLVAPWTRAERMDAFTPTSGQVAGEVVFLSLLTVLLVSSAALARHHLKAGRGDRRGAFHLAGVIFALGMVSWFLGAHHLADRDGEMQILARGAGECLLNAAILWLLYLALEPYVRRYWPHTIISWTRLLAGSIQDPMVGRDILYGAVWAALLALALNLSGPASNWLGYGPVTPRFGYCDAFLGPSVVLAAIVERPLSAMLLSVAALLLLLLLKLLLRRERWAALILCVILTAVQALGNSFSKGAPVWFNVLMAAAIMSSFVALLLRRGLLSGVAGVTLTNILLMFPLSADFGSWNSAPAKVVLLVVGLTMFFAFRASQSGVAPAPASR
jgi:serine/threonine-protein kinase